MRVRACLQRSRGGKLKAALAPGANQVPISICGPSRQAGQRSYEPSKCQDLFDFTATESSHERKRANRLNRMQKPDTQSRFEICVERNNGEPSLHRPGSSTNATRWPPQLKVRYCTISIALGWGGNGLQDSSIQPVWSHDYSETKTLIRKYEDVWFRNRNSDDSKINAQSPPRKAEANERAIHMVICHEPCVS